MKLFQIEEPEGAPLTADGPGAAVGIALAPEAGAVAVAMGGNAEILPGRDGERQLRLSGAVAADGRVDLVVAGALLLGLRERAEKQLARPVTHAVIAAPPLDAASRGLVEEAARTAGLTVLRFLDRAAAAALAKGAPAGEAAALGAALQAEDDVASLPQP
jgi:molecular chaperone DnaK (HSP70)